jgi:2-polyprenyl-6-methoxyphenol hydroxylase-like FAD-dependent oxidoreductase
LYKELSPGLILWGHQFISFETSKGKSTVKIKCGVAATGDVVEMEVNLLVAADGCLSAIRQNFLPNLKLRYALLRSKMLSRKIHICIDCVY